MHGPTLAGLWDSWRLDVEAKDLAASTVDAYGEALRELDEYLASQGLPCEVMAITRQDMQAFLRHLRDDRHLASTTRRTKFAALNVFFNWCLREGEVNLSPLAGVEPPKVVVQPVSVLTNEQIEALFVTCTGAAFIDRRDLAILRVMVATGMRRTEVASLIVDDIDLHSLLVTIRHAKGGRVRRSFIGPKAGQALDRYLRLRRSHPFAYLDSLWLTRQGGMTGDSIAMVVRERSKRAGIAHVHPHMFRHTYASKALAAGHQEGDVMRQAGWASRAMLNRYGAATADERSRDAHRRIGVPGEDL
jgi:site-specific recombinase XerD